MSVMQVEFQRRARRGEGSQWRGRSPFLDSESWNEGYSQYLSCTSKEELGGRFGGDKELVSGWPADWLVGMAEERSWLAAAA